MSLSTISERDAREILKHRFSLFGNYTCFPCHGYIDKSGDIVSRTDDFICMKGTSLGYVISATKILELKKIMRSQLKFLLLGGVACAIAPLMILNGAEPITPYDLAVWIFIFFAPTTIFCVTWYFAWWRRMFLGCPVVEVPETIQAELRLLGTISVGFGVVQALLPRMELIASEAVGEIVAKIGEKAADRAIERVSESVQDAVLDVEESGPSVSARTRSEVSRGAGSS